MQNVWYIQPIESQPTIDENCQTMQNGWYIQLSQDGQKFYPNCQTMQNVWYIQQSREQTTANVYCQTMQNVWYQLLRHVVMNIMTESQCVAELFKMYKELTK